MREAWIAAAAVVFLLAGGAAALWKTDEVEELNINIDPRLLINNHPAEPLRCGGPHIEFPSATRDERKPAYVECKIADFDLPNQDKH